MDQSPDEPDLSRRELLRLTTLLGAGAITSGMSARARAGSDAARRQWPHVSAMIEDHVGSGKLANMIATLGWGQEPPQHLVQGQRLYSGGGAVGPDTLYRIYSMTKPVTGMAAMMCIDEGLLGLDQPLADVLPAFADMQVQKVFDGPITQDNLEPAQRPITIRHLLTHTAGLTYGALLQGPIRDAYNEAGILPAVFTKLPIEEFLGLGTAAPSLTAFADNLAQLPLVSQPGERWMYSVSLDLVGRVIEVVTGQEFASFLRTRIFEPCGMSSTGFSVADRDVGRLTANYFYRDTIPLPLDMPESSVYRDPPPFPFGGGGLVSTAHDYDRFLQMVGGFGMIERRRVMSEAAVRLGTSNLLPDTIAAGGEFREGQFGHGAGGLAGLPGTVAEGMYGWTGAAGTAGFVNMKLGLRMTAMVQYFPPELYGIPEAFPLAVAADLAQQKGAIRAR